MEQSGRSVATRERTPFTTCPKVLQNFSTSPSPIATKYGRPHQQTPVKQKTIPQYMAKTASAKPLLYPVAHLDDLGQRSKHALVGHELCLGALKLHGNGGRGGTALGRTRGDN